MDFEDLVTALAPPPNRVGKSDGGHEHHLYEGAVMVAYAMHLLRTTSAQHVRVHPDGDFASRRPHDGETAKDRAAAPAYGPLDDKSVEG